MTHKEFKLDAEQLNTLLKAIKPTPVMVFGTYVSGLDRQERANEAWKLLGDELGFEHMTVRPVSGKSEEYFTANIKELKKLTKKD